MNHKLPSEPAVITCKPALGVGTANSVNTPAGVIRPTWLAFSSANHRLPSGPAVIDLRPALDVGTVNSVMTPAGVIRPTLLPASSVNHRLPSGPEVISCKPALGVGTGNSVMTPAGVIRPMLLPVPSTNHRLPSGPEVINDALELDVGIGNSVTSPKVAKTDCIGNTTASSSERAKTIFIFFTAANISISYSVYTCLFNHKHVYSERRYYMASLRPLLQIHRMPFSACHLAFQNRFDLCTLRSFRP